MNTLLGSATRSVKHRGIRNDRRRLTRAAHGVLALKIVGSLCACSSVSSVTHIETAACAAEATPIHDIQGAFDTSPFEGQPVTVEGVVVADFEGEMGLGGFFVQEQDGETDANPLTSEGIFIYEGGNQDSVALGDVVSVYGTVAEHEGLTELQNVTGVQVCAHGAAVTPVEVALPAAPARDLESLEGMRVRFTQKLYAADTSNLGHYGEVTLSTQARLRQPTDVVAPGSEAQLLLANNKRSTILLDDTSRSTYPQLLPILGPDGTLRVGDSVEGFAGVLGFGFGSYRVYPEQGTGQTFARDNPRRMAPERVEQTLRVVSFNLNNYFTTVADGTSKCGPLEVLDCRGANSKSEFNRQRTKVLSALGELDPDIAALVELENNTTASLQDIVDGMNASAGEGAYAFIDTGTLGTDAIKVGLIYRPEVVAPAGPFAVLDSKVDSAFVDTLNRPAIAQSFSQLSTGNRFTLVVNHLKSKGSTCPGDPDTGDGQGPCNQTRTAAARAEMAWLSKDPTASGDPDFLIVGDFNAYTREEPIAAFVAGGYTNVLATLTHNGGYSYVFDGQSGALDHALSSASFVGQVVGACEWHINADEPSVLDYNQEHSPATLYNPGPFRSSDHDPVVLDLRLSR